jgi:hypothetical protein
VVIWFVGLVLDETVGMQNNRLTQKNINQQKATPFLIVDLSLIDFQNFSGKK